MGTMLQNPNKKNGWNLGAIQENQEKKTKWIESFRDDGEPKTKGRDRIWAQCLRTRIKRKGSNLGAMPENPKYKRKVSNLGAMPKNPNQK